MFQGGNSVMNKHICFSNMFEFGLIIKYFDVFCLPFEEFSTKLRGKKLFQSVFRPVLYEDFRSLEVLLEIGQSGIPLRAISRLQNIIRRV